MRNLLLFSLFTLTFNSYAQFTDLHDFHGNYGMSYSSLTLYSNKLYGSTGSGGANGDGYLFSVNTDGSNFTDLYDFSSSFLIPCGAPLIINNKIYGMETQGGIYKINLDGTGHTYLHQFAYNDTLDGGSPQGSLILVGSNYTE